MRALNRLPRQVVMFLSCRRGHVWRLQDWSLLGQRPRSREDQSMHQDARTSVVRRFFTGLTEYTFEGRLGVADPPLIDYIAELLVRFVRSDDMYSVRSVRGAVSDMRRTLPTSWLAGQPRARRSRR